MEHARRACSFFLARLRAEIERLRGGVFPGHHPGPHKWLNLADGFIDTAEQYIQQSYDPNLHPDLAGVKVVEAEDLGDQAYDLLEQMLGSDAEHIPHQVVAPFQRWVDGLDIENTIFFRAEHAANYELWIVEYDIDNINGATDSLKAASKAIHWPLLRVTVPGQALGMLPHFAVVAHELGHAIEDRVSIDFDKYDADWQEFVTRVQARIGTLSQDDIIDAKEILSDWLIELKSDAVGFYVAGPAFFFALAGFLEISGRGYGIGRSHPPSDTRLDLLVDHIKSGAPSFANIYKDLGGLDITPEINSPNVMKVSPPDNLFAELSRDLDGKEAAFCVELIPLVKKMGKDIYSSVLLNLKDECADMIYTPAQFLLDWNRHVDALCALIPPIEYNDGGTLKATSLTSILNVGWAALLTRLDDISAGSSTTGDETARRMERLNELLLKAVELSEARRLWDEHQ